jgi:hypothetical protein
MDDTPTHCHKDKKAHMETGTNNTADDTSLLPPSLGTTQTELTDERTEFQATLTTMQGTFSKRFSRLRTPMMRRLAKPKLIFSKPNKHTSPLKRQLSRSMKPSQRTTTMSLKPLLTLAVTSIWPKSNRINVTLALSKRSVQ